MAENTGVRGACNVSCKFSRSLKMHNSGSITTGHTLTKQVEGHSLGARVERTTRRQKACWNPLPLISGLIILMFLLLPTPHFTHNAIMSIFITYIYVHIYRQVELRTTNIYAIICHLQNDVICVIKCGLYFSVPRLSSVRWLIKPMLGPSHASVAKDSPSSSTVRSRPMC